ncbi:hypothetical protein BD410DRAFT_845109 [Rickenella mellea]|uniref:Uncharacterized protein n=1 Tax=Rickenella mellea TaxID=50990 RepID=A0A4Y7PM77_9AGAM|nr:hypothetical protein BD410DRAFT_845109 [Rickenella mellea]
MSGRSKAAEAAAASKIRLVLCKCEKCKAADPEGKGRMILIGLPETVGDPPVQQNPILQPSELLPGPPFKPVPEADDIQHHHGDNGLEGNHFADDLPMDITGDHNEDLQVIESETRESVDIPSAGLEGNHFANDLDITIDRAEEFQVIESETRESVDIPTTGEEPLLERPSRSVQPARQATPEHPPQEDTPAI